MDSVDGEFSKGPVMSLPAELNFLAPSKVEGLLRVGKSSDGGYVIPASCALDVDTLISFGVSTDWSFEEGFKKINPNIDIQTYDYTVSDHILKRNFQKGLLLALLGRVSLRELKIRFELWRSFRSFVTVTALHFPERIHNRVENAYDATPEKVFGRTQSSRIFLKMDIEGSEYRVIDGIVKYADRIRGLVVEFHDTGPLREVFCKAVKKLQEKYEIVHVHGNNYGAMAPDNLPDVLEITFARSGSVQGCGRQSLLPVADLDFPNNPERADYELRFSL